MNTSRNEITEPHPSGPMAERRHEYFELRKGDRWTAAEKEEMTGDFHKEYPGTWEPFPKSRIRRFLYALLIGSILAWLYLQWWLAYGN